LAESKRTGEEYIRNHKRRGFAQDYSLKEQRGRHNTSFGVCLLDSLRKTPSGKPMRFLIDMALSPKTVKFLQELGHEAVRANELGMANSLLSSSLLNIRDSLEKGSIAVIEDYRIRIRGLPVK